MADSSTLRAQRSRLHRRGDHSLCRPERCPAARATAEVAAAPADEPAEPMLGPRGRALWRELTEEGPLPPLAAALALEACRTVDRLDRLDALLRGQDAEWLRLQRDEHSGTTVVVVDRALSEARQQAAALNQLVGGLQRARGGQVATAGRSMSSVTRGGAAAGGITDLTARIAARRQAPAG